MKVHLALLLVAGCLLASATGPPPADHSDAAPIPHPQHEPGWPTEGSNLAARQVNFGPPEVLTERVFTTDTFIGEVCPNETPNCSGKGMVKTTRLFTVSISRVRTRPHFQPHTTTAVTNVNTPAPTGSTPLAASSSRRSRFRVTTEIVSGIAVVQIIHSTLPVNAPASSVAQASVDGQSVSPPATDPKAETLSSNSAPQPASASLGSSSGANTAPSAAVSSSNSVPRTTPLSSSLVPSSNVQPGSSSSLPTGSPPPSTGATPSLSNPVQTSSTVPVSSIAPAGTNTAPPPSLSGAPPSPSSTSKEGDNVAVVGGVVGGIVGGIVGGGVAGGRPPLPPGGEPEGPEPGTLTNTDKTSTTSCKEEVAETTYVTCTGTITSKDCRPYTTSTFTSCNATSGVTTKFCSTSQVTHSTIFCASTGSAQSCVSTNSVATQVVSGCDLTATQTTTYAPACPAQMTLGPDMELDNNGALEDYPRTFGPPEPSCETPDLVDYTVPYDNVLKPAIEDFCSKSGEGVLVSGARTWESHCSFGQGSTVLQIYVASNEGKPCETEKLKKEDCIKQLSAIGNKCVSKDSKNDRIDGEVWDQKCHGYMFTVMTWVEGSKPPPCKTASATLTDLNALPSPTGDPNAPSGWQFQVVAQWRQSDYDTNAKDQLEFALWGVRAGVNITSCAYYAPYDFNAPGKKYGDSVHHDEPASANGVSGGVRDLVDKPDSQKMLPFELTKAGGGVWPKKESISLNGPCEKNCVVRRHKERKDELYVMCDRPLADCKPIKDQGLSGLVDKRSISYRCREVPKNKLPCSFPGDLKKDRNTGMNNFLQLLVCDSTGGGSGVMTIDPPNARNNYKDVNFALVYHWTQTNFNADRGPGELQLYSYERDGSALNCDLFNTRPGEAFAFIEQPLNTIPDWPREAWKAWKVWMQNNDMKPRPKPSSFPNSISTDEAKTLAWPEHACVKRCVLQKQGGKDEWWVRCNKEGDKCTDKAPADKPYFDIKCKDVWPTDRLHCGSDSQNYFYPIMECAGNGDAGWFKMIEENKPTFIATANFPKTLPKDLPKATPKPDPNAPPIPKPAQKPPPNAPKPVPGPAQKPPPKESHKDISFALVYHWTEGNYKANIGSGDSMLYTYKDASLGLFDCEFFDKQPGYDYGLYQKPLKELIPDLWGGLTLSAYVDSQKGKPSPPPNIPIERGLARAIPVTWGQSKCARHCRFRKLEDKKKFVVYCENQDAECAEQPPDSRAGWSWTYDCDDYGHTTETQKCGSDRLNYFRVVMMCKWVPDSWVRTSY